MLTNQPIHTLTEGDISAAIWANTKTPDGQPFYCITFARLDYSGEHLHHWSTFGHEDLSRVAKLAQDANAYLNQLAQQEK